ncbi:cell envelope integrity EipB family protein [Chthonobacter rhizosphaerae]|uniref:cell envelope integrity EipB family protein n=1 Tax=Chthonobacter rhizosphaerae TaxID=2735553 RepID=UPI001AEE6E2B|nr:cell envelope integrity EipB family protein [Chthonobacter rhizosphaerae]
MRALVWTAVTVAAVAGLVPAASAAPVSLLPHRAVYDLRLAESPAGGGESMASVSGRMVFEFTGTPCEGYTVNFRFVIEMTDGEGQATVTDLRTSTFEDGPGTAFEFLSQTYTNQVLTEEVKGSAARTDKELTVQLTTPAEAKVSFAPDVIFPTAHLVRIIEAAKAGTSVVSTEIFDGSETGDKVYATSTIIGQEETGPVTGPEATLQTRRRWPVTVAYFDAAATGDLTPEYSIGFDLYENGVSSDLRMDYGDFALDGDLKHFEALPAAPCE